MDLICSIAQTRKVMLSKNSETCQIKLRIFHGKSYVFQGNVVRVYRRDSIIIGLGMLMLSLLEWEICWIGLKPIGFL